MQGKNDNHLNTIKPDGTRMTEEEWYADDGNIFKGLFYGTLFGLPLWGLIIAGAHGLLNLLR